jgi:glycosyltransferase involved in cell wall biosynthesis
LKIGIDARFLVERRTGVETYCHEILRRLVVLEGPEEYVLFRCGGDPDLPPGHWRHAGRPDGARGGGAWHALTLLLQERPDLFYSPVTAFPLLGASRRVVTVHDLAWHQLPEHYPLDQRLRHRLWLRMAARKADRIVVVSQTTRDHLLALQPGVSGRTTVIPAGVDEDFFQEVTPEARRRVRERYALTDRYVLTVGAFHPRKNLPRLVEAYDRFRAGTREGVLLVIGGGAGEDRDRIRQRVASSPHRGDILLPGYVPREDLPALYAEADLFVMPSHQEGFGIPPLEAMACGTPVLVSDLPIFREVCGDAAVRARAADPDDIARGLAAARRGAPGSEDRVRLGREWARRFRWENSALRMRDLFREILSRARAA